MPGDRRQCMPGDEVWLVGERRSTGEQKYYVSNLPAEATLNTLAAAIKARRISRTSASAAQGRTWPRPLRRQILDRITPTCLDVDDSLRLPPVPPPQASGTEKKNRGPPPQPGMPALRQAIPDLFAWPPTRRCPPCEKPLTDPLDPNLPM